MDPLAPIVELSRRMSTYAFFPPTYEATIDDLVVVLEFLKSNKQDPSSTYFRHVKNLFWENVMKVAKENNFSTKDSN